MALAKSGRVSIGGIFVKCVKEFCYLVDKSSVGGEVEASSVARDRSGWKSTVQKTSSSLTNE